MVGPVVSGIMSDAYGWRSFWWCNVALVGALIALTIVAQPETKFRRSLMPSAPSNPEVQKSEEDQIDSSIEHHIDQHLGRGKPTKRQYLPVSGFEADKRRLFRDIVTP
jgi:MFS family permease